MKVAGFLLMPAGFILVLAAIAMLRAPVPEAGFALAGVAVEVLGLVLAARSHMTVRRRRP